MESKPTKILIPLLGVCFVSMAFAIHALGGTALKIMGDTMAEAKQRGFHVPPEWKLRMIMAHPGMDAASVAAVSGTADDVMRTRIYSEESREE